MGFDLSNAISIFPSNGRKSRRPWTHKKDCALGDEWQIHWLADLGISMQGFNTGGTISGAQSIAMMTEMGLLKFKQMLCDQLTVIAFDWDGQIDITVKQKHYHKPNELSYGSFKLNQRNFQTEFRAMLKFLKKANLNYLGPLGALCCEVATRLPSNHRGSYICSVDFSR